MASLGNARREASELSDEARYLLKKYPHLLDAEKRAQVEQARTELDAARKTKDAARITSLTAGLDELLERSFPEVRKGPVRQYVESIGKAVLVALALRVFVVEAFKIPSGSMYPTLYIGDHLFVSKFLYGVRLPFINYQLIQWSLPHRGDVIVFNDPRDGSKDLIKRVAGVPGDTISVVDEVIYINGQPQPRKLLRSDFSYFDFHEPDPMDPRSYWETREGMEEYEETLGEKVHHTLQRPGERPRPTQGPYVVPPNSVFVMGDNRDNSADSRFGAWTVPYGHIKGKAFIIWLSVGKGGWWFCHGDGPLCTESGIHFDRFFQVIH